MTFQDRVRGALFGLACGDALGTTVEFESPGSFEPVTNMTGGGPFELRAGEYTDDTAIALCLAESIVETGGFDPDDQMQRYVRWMRDGHLASNGSCFDIGNTTREALNRYLQTGEPFSGPTHTRSAGKGNLMRLAPVPLAFCGDIATAVRYCGESSWTTHGAPVCVDACRYFGTLLCRAASGEPKKELLDDRYARQPLPDGAGLAEEITRIASGSFLRMDPPEIRGTGYVVASLEAALWAFARSQDFREGRSPSSGLIARPAESSRATRSAASSKRRRCLRAVRGSMHPSRRQTLSVLRSSLPRAEASTTWSSRMRQRGMRNSGRSRRVYCFPSLRAIGHRMTMITISSSSPVSRSR